MPKRRITLSLDDDLIERFQAAADQERKSLSSCVNSWLHQVVQPAEFVSGLAEEARDIGSQKINALIASLQVAQEQSVSVVLGAKQGSRAKRASGAPHAVAAVPPLCNTGGKFSRSKGAPRA